MNRDIISISIFVYKTQLCSLIGHNNKRNWNKLCPAIAIMHIYIKMLDLSLYLSGLLFATILMWLSRLHYLNKSKIGYNDLKTLNSNYDTINL